MRLRPEFGQRNLLCILNGCDAEWSHGSAGAPCQRQIPAYSAVKGHACYGGRWTQGRNAASLAYGDAAVFDKQSAVAVGSAHHIALIAAHQQHQPGGSDARGDGAEAHNVGWGGGIGASSSAGAEAAGAEAGGGDSGGALHETSLMQPPRAAASTQQQERGEKEDPAAIS